MPWFDEEESRIYFTKHHFTHAENGQHMVDELRGGVIEQFIYFLPYILSFTLSFFLILSPFGGCLSLGNHYSVCNSQTSETEKRGKCFHSQRKWERGNVVRDWKWIHMFMDRFYPHSRQYCTDGELLRVQLPWSVELLIIPVPDLRSSSKMNHFHVSAHHTFSQLICKSPMSSFPFLCSGHEPR